MVDTSLIIEGIKAIKAIYDQVQTMKKVKVFMANLDLQTKNIESILEYPGFNAQLATGNYPELEATLKTLEDILKAECYTQILKLERHDFKSKVKQFLQASGNKEKYEELVSKTNGAIQNILLTLQIDNFIKNEDFRQWMQSHAKEVLEILDEQSQQFKKVNEKLEKIEEGVESLKQQSHERGYAIDRPVNVNKQAKVDNLKAGISNLTHVLPEKTDEAFQHQQTMADKGIRSVVTITDNAVLGTADIGICNIDFSKLEKKEDSPRIEQISEQCQTRFFSSPNPGEISNFLFIVRAEKFLNILDKENQFINELSLELQDLINMFKKHTASATKTERDKIRDKIEEIKDVEAEITSSSLSAEQKKTVGFQSHH